MRRWLVRFGLGILSIPLVLAGGLSALMWPYFRDDRALDEVVRVVALDWRDFGREKAEARLKFEVDARGVGFWVGDDSCRLDEAPAAAELEPGERRVRCGWQTFVLIPGLSGRGIPLQFSSVAILAADGDVR